MTAESSARVLRSPRIVSAIFGPRRCATCARGQAGQRGCHFGHPLRRLTRAGGPCRVHHFAYPLCPVVPHARHRDKVRAERRCGELLRDTAARGERAAAGEPVTQMSKRSTSAPPTLADMCLTRDESSRYQQLAERMSPIQLVDGLVDGEKTGRGALFHAGLDRRSLRQRSSIHAGFRSIDGSDPSSDPPIQKCLPGGWYARSQPSR